MTGRRVGPRPIALLLLMVLLLLHSPVNGKATEQVDNPSTSADAGEVVLGSTAAEAAQEVWKARVIRDFAPIRAAPGADRPLIWRLYEGTQVTVAEQALATDGNLWWRVRLWNSHNGWLESDSISFEPYPPPPPPQQRVLAPTAEWPPGLEPPTPSPVQPLLAPAVVLQSATLSATPDAEGSTMQLPPGIDVVADRWAVGADQRVRYRVSTATGVEGWAAPGTVALRSADAATRQVNGRPLADTVHGKGMWFVLDSREHGVGAGARVAQAARANGLTHLYVEVATSHGGFFGGAWLQELLPAARAANVRVIGSLYAWLDDIPGDLALALEVGRYRTPGGFQLDGLTVDIEETLVAENVQAFGELLRHYVGDDYLLVATTYPPESWFAPRYPWPALAASWNVIAPMAYWRQMEERPFTPEEVDAYTRRMVAGVRALAGRPDLPVEMLGQLFEMGRPRLLGPDPPTPGEVEAAVGAARDAGAVGISFFDWTRATPDHWAALAALEW